MSIIQHNDAEGVGRITEVVVEPRKLSMHHKDMEVIWRDSADIEVAMRAANQQHSLVVPQDAAAGYVLVALAIDGDETLHEVVTSDMGADLTTKLGLVDSAIELLEVTRAGIVAATVGQRTASVQAVAS